MVQREEIVQRTVPPGRGNPMEVSLGKYIKESSTEERFGQSVKCNVPKRDSSFSFVTLLA